MSRELLKAQRIDIEGDEIWINNVKKDSVAGDIYARVFLTFSGAVGAQTIQRPVVLYRVGRLVQMTIADGVYNGEQAAGLITSTAIPVEFRPGTTIPVTGFQIINGSQAGGTASNATQLGAARVDSNGVITFGIDMNNIGTLEDFGGAGVSGSGNGICPAQLTWTV